MLFSAIMWKNIQGLYVFIAQNHRFLAAAVVKLLSSFDSGACLNPTSTSIDMFRMLFVKF
jgi:hypothetical protein